MLLVKLDVLFCRYRIGVIGWLLDLLLDDMLKVMFWVVIWDFILWMFLFDMFSLWVIIFILFWLN